MKLTYLIIAIIFVGSLSAFGELSVSCPSSDLKVGTPYNGIMSISGGSGSGYTLTYSGTLPSGLAITGQSISGIPSTGSAGEYQFTASALDSNRNTASASCLLNVTQMVWVCGYNGGEHGLFYTQQACGNSCFGVENCSLYTGQKKPFDVFGMCLAGFMVGAVIFLVFWIPIGSSISIGERLLIKFWNSNKPGMFPFETPIRFPENGMHYDYADQRVKVTFGNEVYLKQRLRSWGRPNDTHIITSNDYLLNWQANDKYDKSAEFVHLPSELVKYKNMTLQLQTENASLRTEFKQFSNNIMQIVKENAAFYEAIRKCIGGTTFMEPHRREGGRSFGQPGGDEYGG